MVKLFHFFVLFPLICSNQELQNHDYCNLDREHVMCVIAEKDCFHKSLPGEELSDNQHNTIIKLHNDLRHKYASGKGMSGKFPKASNMMLMQRDPELEKIAQMAATCTLISKNYIYDVKKFKVKQYNYTSTTNNLNEQKLPKEFVDSLKRGVFSSHVSESIVSNYVPNEEYDFIARAIWATTSKIGCGRLIKGERITTFVCLYGPAGIIPGESIYIEGEPCKNCPSQMPQCYADSGEEYPNLCQPINGVMPKKNQPSANKIHNCKIYEDEEDYGKICKDSSAIAVINSSATTRIFIWSITYYFYTSIYSLY